MKLFVFICNLILFPGTFYAQALIRSSINSSASSNSSKIRQTIGQPISSVMSSNFYYGYQSPILQSVLNAESESIIVYPNPVKTSLHIQSTSLNHVYKLFTSTGQLIKKGKLTNRNNQVGLVSFSMGVYILHILINDKIVYKMKILKE